MNILRKSSESEFPKHEVRQAIQKGISQAEQQLTQETSSMARPRNWFVFLSSSVAVGCALLIGATILSQSNTGGFSNIPFLSALLEDEDSEVIDEQPKNLELRRFEGGSQTIDGQTVTIEDALYDQSVLTINYSIESETENFEESAIDSVFSHRVDEKELNAYGEFTSEQVISPTELTGYNELDLRDDLPNEFTLGMTLTADQDEVWDFTFLIKEVEGLPMIPVYNNQVLEGITLNIDSITQTENELIIPITLKEPLKKDESYLSPSISIKLIDPNTGKTTILSGDGSGDYSNQWLHFNSRIRVDLEEVEMSDQMTIVPIIKAPGKDLEFDSFNIELIEE